MRSHQRVSASRPGKGIVLALVLSAFGLSAAWVKEDAGARAAPSVKDRLEATIFTYDGKDFVRSKTTMTTSDGKPAVNTKLDHDTPAYKALVEKHSYTGDATIFGRKYDANYAPLTSEDGKLTGALFVAVGK